MWLTVKVKLGPNLMRGKILSLSLLTVGSKRLIAIVSLGGISNKFLGKKDNDY